MRMRQLALGVALAATVAVPDLTTRALAQDSIYVPLLTYRTGQFAARNSDRQRDARLPDHAQ